MRGNCNIIPKEADPGKVHCCKQKTRFLHPQTDRENGILKGEALERMGHRGRQSLPRPPGGAYAFLVFLDSTPSSMAQM